MKQKTKQCTTNKEIKLEAFTYWNNKEIEYTQVLSNDDISSHINNELILSKFYACSTEI